CLSIPRRAGVLCERISGLFPVPGRVVTLTTSGEEAVQCALRTAMAATGRPGLLRVDPFAPAPGVQVRVSTGMAVLPGSVPANLAMVEAALDESVGALFLEPFVNELAPDGRAAAAQLYQSIAQLCRSRGTVLVVDERLTAMRTAAVFAFPDLGLDPDIVLLGESLGAAAVPLGATCVRPELWELASQHFPGSPVAISPLGGNDLGAVAGLATLDRVEDPAFWEGVRASGLELREGLTGVVERYAFATKAYGAGLLWHLRCAAPMDEALEGLRDDITARSPGALRTMIRELPVDVRQTGTVWSALFADALEQFLFDRINTKLAQDHHILLDRTRRASRTLLMAPPLTISTAQVQRFARALDAVFDDLSTFDIGAR
ncbi:MAG: aminotransferase class III-fold pyridoxal phosphate-dependent enzyme, partial [Bifidobacteriaceae bacterium]|nr:aminotransferase class III-fold pyridoxal phosphate-dependent enzyme [Bifidobacteriaceae bacterium]